MKKLTAGIFATLLAVVSADSAYAAIASKGYVDDQVGEVQTAVTAVKGDVSTLKTTVEGHTTQIAAKADSSTVTALAGRVTTAEGEIDTLQTEVDGKQDALGFTPENSANKTTTLSGTSTDKQYPSAKAVWDTIQTETEGIASDTDVTALKGRVDTLETASANHVVKNEAITGGTHTKITYDAKGLVTAGANLTAEDIPTIPNAKVSGLGSLATKSTVTSADITDGTIAEGDLNESINASLGKADTALQKTAADAAYAVKSTETVASTASTNAEQALADIGTKSELTTTNKNNLVGAINELDAAMEGMATNDTIQGIQTDLTELEGKVDTNTTNIGTNTTHIGTVGNLSTTAKTDLVSAVNEVKTQADKGVSDAAAAQSTANTAKSTADSALTKADAAIPAPGGECAEPANKCVLTYNNTVYAWEVIERGSSESSN